MRLINQSILKPFFIISCHALLIVTSQHSLAHNRVVVIPLSGDDIVIEQTKGPTFIVSEVDPSESDYVVNPNSVIDNTNQLEWQRRDDNVMRNWQQAFDYCAALTLDSKSGWRLPDVKELHSLVDYGQGSVPYIERNVFPESGTGYWSVSFVANDFSRAWFVDFSSGSVRDSLKTGVTFVRCVRQG